MSSSSVRSGRSWFCGWRRFRLRNRIRSHLHCRTYRRYRCRRRIDCHRLFWRFFDVLRLRNGVRLFAEGNRNVAGLSRDEHNGLMFGRAIFPRPFITNFLSAIPFGFAESEDVVSIRFEDTPPGQWLSCFGLIGRVVSTDHRIYARPFADLEKNAVICGSNHMETVRGSRSMASGRDQKSVHDFPRRVGTLLDCVASAESDLQFLSSFLRAFVRVN